MLRSKLLWFSATNIAAAMAALLVDGPAHGATMSIIVIFLSSVVWQYLWPAEYRGSADASDPIFLAGTIVFLAFGVRAGAFVFELVPEDRKEIPYWSGLGVEFNEYYARSLLFGLACWAGLLLGYRILGGRMSQGSDYDPTGPEAYPSETLWPLTLTVLGLGWAARLYIALFTSNRTNQLDAGDTGTLESLARATSLLSTVGLILVLFLSSRHAGKAWWKYWFPLALVLAELFFSWYLNSRTSMFAVFIYILAFTGLSRPLRIRLAWLATIPVALIAIAASLLYRNAPSNITGVIDRSAFVLDQSRLVGPFQMMADGASSIVGRYHGLDSVAVILAQGPMQIPRYGAMYLISALSPLIPRAFWPSKPTYRLGDIFSINYFNRTEETSVPLIPTWFGDLGLQFPPIVVPVICVLIGIGLRILRAKSLKSGGGLTIWSVAAVLATPFVMRMDAWIPVYQLTILILAAAGVMLLARRRALVVEIQPNQTAAVVRSQHRFESSVNTRSG